MSGISGSKDCSGFPSNLCIFVSIAALGVNHASRSFTTLWQHFNILIFCVVSLAELKQQAESHKGCLLPNSILTKWNTHNNNIFSLLWSATGSIDNRMNVPCSLFSWFPAVEVESELGEWGTPYEGIVVVTIGHTGAIDNGTKQKSLQLCCVWVRQLTGYSIGLTYACLVVLQTMPLLCYSCISS